MFSHFSNLLGDPDLLLIATALPVLGLAMIATGLVLIRREGPELCKHTRQCVAETFGRDGHV